MLRGGLGCRRLFVHCWEQGLDMSLECGIRRGAERAVLSGARVGTHAMRVFCLSRYPLLLSHESRVDTGYSQWSVRSSIYNYIVDLLYR